MLAIFPKKRYESISSWVLYANTTFGGFVVGKLLDALFMTVACSIVFGIAGIPYSVLIAVIIGISNIIPFFGPFIGAIPSGFIVLIASDTSKLFLFVFLLLLIQQFDANVVEPKIVGDKTGLTSLGVIAAVLIMSGYFGILGTFFGVPIYAIICSIIRSFVDNGLKKKELSTELADYYPENSLVDPKEQAEKKNIFKWFGNLILLLWNKIKQSFAASAAKRNEKKLKKQEKRNEKKNG
jgi:predicted PurR-regulated permease PerM